MEGLSGKRALVTGGAAGIGRAIALELARSGCDIALIDVDVGKAEATAGEVRALGRKAATAAGDVSDAGSVRAALAKLAGEPFDILVNNAGICRLGALLTMSEKAGARRWRSMSTAPSTCRAPLCPIWSRASAGLS